MLGVLCCSSVLLASWLFIYPSALVRSGLPSSAQVPLCSRLFKRSGSSLWFVLSYSGFLPFYCYLSVYCSVLFYVSG